MWCWEISSLTSTEPAHDLSLGNIMPNERVSHVFLVALEFYNVSFILQRSIVYIFRRSRYCPRL